MSRAQATLPQARPAVSSTARTLIQAAALAAALVPLGSIPTEAASITCGFGGSTTSDSGCGNVGGSGFVTFNFGGYKVGLEFFGVTEPFDMTVTDTEISQLAFDSLVAPFLGSYDCVTLVAPTSTDPGCRSFNFSSSSEGDVWDSYATLFAWDFATDDGMGGGPYPNGEDPDGSGPQPGRIRVLQAPGESTTFSIDMCLAALTDPDYPPCLYSVSVGSADPGIRSGNSAFSDQIVATTTVPEPASLVLLGTGLAGVLYRKRCRSIRH